MAALRVLELYSGIGGMHQALRESCTSAEVVAAVDVNTLANEVYKHNFPSTPLWAKTIEGITLKEFDRLSFDMILMSPPCQPFTRIGLQGDVSDPRTKSFLYILDILPRLQKLPKYILLENVKGFESSSARNELLRTLVTCGFKYQEFLLSPTCLGIPNSRLRYFLIAKLQQEPFFFHAPGQILTRFPDLEDKIQDLEELCKDEVVDKVCESSSLPSGEKSLDPNVGPHCSSNKSLPKGAFLFKLETAEEIARKHNQDNDSSIQMLKDFLEEENEEMSRYFLAPKFLVRYAFLLDIVKPTCRRSTCFTKGYGHYVEGTGSVLQTAVDVQLESVFKHIENLPEEEKLRKLSTLKLRYFTPREIANLHGFPPEFEKTVQAIGQLLHFITVFVETRESRSKTGQYQYIAHSSSSGAGTLKTSQASEFQEHADSHLLQSDLLTNLSLVTGEMHSSWGQIPASALTIGPSLQFLQFAASLYHFSSFHNT